MREDGNRLGVALIGAEAMLRLFGEPEPNPRAFTALTRFLDGARAGRGAMRRPALDPLALSFQLKLLWLSGYLPHLGACVECGARSGARRLLAARRRRRLRRARARRRSRSRPRGSPGSSACSRPRSPRRTRPRSATRARREALAIVTSSYEEHGGFRLRTLSA